MNELLLYVSMCQRLSYVIIHIDVRSSGKWRNQEGGGISLNIDACIDPMVLTATRQNSRALMCLACIANLKLSE